MFYQSNKKPYNRPLMSDYEAFDNLLSEIEESRKRRPDCTKDILLISNSLNII